MSSFPQQAWKTALTANDATAQEELGAIRADHSTAGEKVYKYVQNKSGGAGAAGTAFTYVLTDDSGYQVTTLAGADGGSGAGIGVGVLADDYYGWVQVAGIASALIKGDTDATTAGALVGTSATAGKLGGGTGYGTSYAQDAVSTDVAGIVFLRGLI